MRQIYLTNTLDDAFSGVLAPWFHGVGRTAWKEPLPSLVVAPDLSSILHLRSLLHHANIPVFGVQFLTVGQLLPLIRTDAESALPDSGLLELVAERVASDMAQGSEIAAAVARGPRLITETLRALHQGGWRAANINGEMLRAIGVRVEESLSAQGLATVEAAAHLLTADAQPTEVFHALLLVGFDGRHWASWPALLSAMRRSKHFTAIFGQARVMAEESDLCWISSWEEYSGVTAEPVEAQNAAPEASALIELGKTGAAPIKCLVAGTQQSEARLAVRCAAEALNAGAASVAIVAPPASVVARETSLVLSRVSWPHFDGLPSYQSSVGHPEVLSALLRVQSEPFLEHLAHFLRLRLYLPEELDLRADSAVRGLERLAPNLIFPEINIAVEYVRANGDKRVLPLLEQWPVWEEKGTLKLYLDQLVALTEWLEWDPIARLARDLRLRMTPAFGLGVTRSGACRWMQKVLLESSSFRAELANHPYARIHLLAPSAALYRRWDALIVAGQNDSIWPPRAEPGGYLSEDDLQGLNNRIRDLNANATSAGAAGEGGASVRPGHAYIVGPFEYRAMQGRDFVRLVDASSTTYVLCALRDETQGDAILYPGELFSRAFAAGNGHAPTNRELEEIAALADGALPYALTAAPAAEVDPAQMLLAWKARRRKDAREFSEYEFCMEGRPTWDMVIPPSAWGRVFDRPAETYFRYFLGVTPKQEKQEQLATPMVMGNWVHAWLEAASPTGAAAKGNEWVDRVNQAAGNLRARVAGALKNRGREVPTWWDSLFQQSLQSALGFAGALSRGGRHPYLISEAKLPRTDITLASGRKLPAEGRMDLVFLDGPPIEAAEMTFAGRPWLFDFKNGQDKPLTVPLLAKGLGIQLGLYALAIEARGAEMTDITLLKKDGEAVPQVNSRDVRQQMMPVLERLADIIDTGRLGYHGPIRSEFPGSSIYPIATLPINVDRKPLFKTLHGL